MINMVHLSLIFVFISSAVALPVLTTEESSIEQQQEMEIESDLTLSSDASVDTGIDISTITEQQQQQPNVNGLDFFRRLLRLFWPTTTDGSTHVTPKYRSSRAAICEPPEDTLETFIEGFAAVNPGLSAVLSLSQLAESQVEVDWNPRSQIPYSKAVCEEMEKKLNTIAPTNETTTCPWAYTCSFNANRFPRYIIQAKCLESYCVKTSCKNSTDGSLEIKQCKPMNVVTPILSGECDSPSTGNDSSTWTVVYENINLGCLC